MDKNATPLFGTTNALCHHFKSLATPRPNRTRFAPARVAWRIAANIHVKYGRPAGRY